MRATSWIPMRALAYYGAVFAAPWIIGFLLVAGAAERRVQSLERARLYSAQPVMQKHRRDTRIAADEHAVEAADLAERDSRATRDASLILAFGVPLAGVVGIFGLGYGWHLYRRWRLAPRRW